MKVGKPFYKMLVIRDSFKEFCSSEGLKPDTMRSGEGSFAHCPEVWEGWVTSPYLHYEMKPGKHNSHSSDH